MNIEHFWFFVCRFHLEKFLWPVQSCPADQQTKQTVFRPNGSELFLLTAELALSGRSEVKLLLCVCVSLCCSELQTDGFSDSSICVAPAVWSALRGPRRAPPQARYVNRIIMWFASIDERARRAEVRSCGGDGLHLHPVRWVGAASRRGGRAPSSSCRWPHVEPQSGDLFTLAAVRLTASLKPPTAAVRRSEITGTYSPNGNTSVSNAQPLHKLCDLYRTTRPATTIDTAAAAAAQV